MKKHKDYYYTTKLYDVASRNNSTLVKYYHWFIRNKEGEVLQQSESMIEGKENAEYDCIEHINEYYY